MIFLSGARRSQPREFAAISSSIIEAGDRVPHDAWLQNIYPGDEGRINEVSQGRLSLMIYFGRLALERMDLRLNDGEVVEGYQFTAEERGVGGLRCVIINGRPVSRTNVAGQPRPTTESCAQEWLTGNYAPQANVMLVSNNPHIRRTTASVEAVAKCHVDDDIAIYGCGPAAYDDAKTSLFLGEVGRLLYTDFMHQQRGKEGVY